MLRERAAAHLGPPTGAAQRMGSRHLLLVPVTAGQRRRVCGPAVAVPPALHSDLPGCGTSPGGHVLVHGPGGCHERSGVASRPVCGHTGSLAVRVAADISSSKCRGHLGPDQSRATAGSGAAGPMRCATTVVVSPTRAGYCGDTHARPGGGAPSPSADTDAQAGAGTCDGDA